MTFTPINVVNGTTPANATWGNNAQTQYTEAINSFEQDLFAPFVLSGLLAVKDGSIANQLDVPAGVAFLLQSDLTLRRRNPAASNQTTSTPSTTYYLFLNSDGTFTWGTSASGPANSIGICQVTTDGSGNILVVTDVRPLSAKLLFGQAIRGILQFPALTQWGTTPSLSIDTLGSSIGINIPTPAAPTATVVAGTALGVGVYKYAVSIVSINGETLPGTQQTATTTTNNQAVNLTAIPTGPTGTVARKVYRTAVGGSALKLLTTLTDNATTAFNDTTADGSLGAGPLVHPTLGGDVWKNNAGTQVAAIFADGAAIFGSTATPKDATRFGIGLNGSTDVGMEALGGANAVLATDTGTIWFRVNYYNDGTNDRFVAATPAYAVYVDNNGNFHMRTNTGSPVAGGIITWAADAVFIGGAQNPSMNCQIRYALPTDRNGVATSVEVYTGTNTPSGDGVTTPRTGAIWIKA